MGDITKIEWADSTANFWMGCTKVSPACDFCYAERDMADFHKLVKWGPHAERRPVAAGAKVLAKAQRDAAAFFAAHGRRQRVFVMSLGDWLDNAAPIDLLARLLESVHRAPDVDVLMLTKRPQNWQRRLEAVCEWLESLQVKTILLDWVRSWLLGAEPPRNVWFGVSTENRTEFDRRVPVMRAIPAVIRFISAEPLLGSLAGADFTGIDWIIGGGESGPHARASHPQWFRELAHIGNRLHIPFLFKQWGEWADDGPAGKPECIVMPWGYEAEPPAWFFSGGPPAAMVKVGKKAAGRLLDGIEHNEFPVARAV